MALGFFKRLQQGRERHRKPLPFAVQAPAAGHDPSRCALLVLAHPALHRSHANAALLTAARALPEITVHDLYETYADFLIDVEAEQQRLLDHRLIILQFPFYWYSTPSLLKEWLDMVWLHGFAYGRNGTRLHGKTMMVAVTTGAPPEAYQPRGINRFSMTEFLRPLEATAHLCGLAWAEPFIVHDAIKMTDAAQQEAAQAYTAWLEEAITAVVP